MDLRVSAVFFLRNGGGKTSAGGVLPGKYVVGFIPPAFLRDFYQEKRAFSPEPDRFPPAAVVGALMSELAVAGTTN